MADRVPLRSAFLPGFATASPTASLENWSVEQMPGGRVTTHEGALVIEDTGGCAV